MFKRIEIWVLYLVLVLSFVSHIIFGGLLLREIKGGYYRPIISEAQKVVLFLSNLPANVSRLAASKNPNLALEQRFTSKSGFIGSSSEQEMYLLLSKYDGDINQGIVELIDLKNFEVLHSYNPDFDLMNENVKSKEPVWKRLKIDRSDSRAKLRHPIFNNDGSIIFNHDSPLWKIDSDSKLIWSLKDEKYHHSLNRDYEGNFWTCVSYYPYRIDSWYVGEEHTGYLDDGIRKISPDGEILFDKSLSELFIENGMEHLLFANSDRGYKKDPLHLNDIEPVNFNSSYWLKGDVFISLRHQSMVLLYRPSTNEIIWKTSGQFFHQHDVDILDENRISIYDNNSKDTFNGDKIDGSNRVIIYNFSDDSFSTYLNDAMKNQEVRTVTDGLCEILPNGDMFVEEQNYGRILLFNKDGTIKWQYFNTSNSNKSYFLGWSRILYSEEDIKMVRSFLKSKIKVASIE